MRAASLIYVLGVGTADKEKRAEAIREQFPDVSYLSLSELFEAPLLTEFSRALTRARVQQYQRYLADADRILILLHNEPDPDAMASGLALQDHPPSHKATAVIAALEGVTRPENVRMANLLDIHVETITPNAIDEFDRVCMVDVQPHYFQGLDRVDLVIDHHPEQHGYNAVFKDIREDYGSTCTILTEHLRAIDASISERTATAMLYAIKSDTLFFNRQANRCDIEAFSYLYPLADANLIRKMEGAEITLERLQLIGEGDAARKAWSIRSSRCSSAKCRATTRFRTWRTSSCSSRTSDGRWSPASSMARSSCRCAISAIRETPEISCGGISSDIGSAGGHRAMAKAIVPIEAFQARFGPADRSHRRQMSSCCRSSCTRRRKRRRGKSRSEATDADSQSYGARDHRFDELPVRVFVSPIHQLAQALKPVGALVVGAREIERPDGIVRGLNEKHPLNLSCGSRPHRVWPRSRRPQDVRPRATERPGRLTETMRRRAIGVWRKRQ